MWHIKQWGVTQFVKGYGFLSFGKNIDKNINRKLSDKHSSGMLATPQKLLDHAGRSATDAFKTALTLLFVKFNIIISHIFPKNFTVVH